MEEEVVDIDHQTTILLEKNAPIAATIQVALSMKGAIKKAEAIPIAMKEDMIQTGAILNTGGVNRIAPLEDIPKDREGAIMKIALEDILNGLETASIKVGIQIDFEAANMKVIGDLAAVIMGIEEERVIRKGIPRGIAEESMEIGIENIPIGLMERIIKEDIPKALGEADMEIAIEGRSLIEAIITITKEGIQKDLMEKKEVMAFKANIINRVIKMKLVPVTAAMTTNGLKKVKIEIEMKHLSDILNSIALVPRSMSR